MVRKILIMIIIVIFNDNDIMIIYSDNTGGNREIYCLENRYWYVKSGRVFYFLS